MTAGQLLRERGRVIKRKREREHEVRALIVLVCIVMNIFTLLLLFCYYSVG